MPFFIKNPSEKSEGFFVLWRFAWRLTECNFPHPDSYRELIECNADLAVLEWFAFGSRRREGALKTRWVCHEDPKTYLPAGAKKGSKRMQFPRMNANQTIKQINADFATELICKISVVLNPLPIAIGMREMYLSLDNVTFLIDARRFHSTCTNRNHITRWLSIPLFANEGKPYLEIDLQP